MAVVINFILHDVDDDESLRCN